MMTHCPYNHSHTFEKKRIIYHVKTCKDQYFFENKKLVSCPYDTSIFYFRDEEEMHKSQCSNCNGYNKTNMNAKLAELSGTFPSEIFDIKFDDNISKIDLNISDSISNFSFKDDGKSQISRGTSKFDY